MPHLIASSMLLKWQISDWLTTHEVQKQSYDVREITNLINDVRHKHILLSEKGNTGSFSYWLDVFDFYVFEPIRGLFGNTFDSNQNVINVEAFSERCNQVNKDNNLSCSDYSGLEVANLSNNLFEIGHFTPHHTPHHYKSLSFEKQRNEIIEKFMKHELDAFETSKSHLFMVKFGITTSYAVCESRACKFESDLKQGLLVSDSPSAHFDL